MTAKMARPVGVRARPGSHARSPGRDRRRACRAPRRARPAPLAGSRRRRVPHHQEGDGDDGGAQRHLQRVGGQREADQRAADRGSGVDQGERHAKAQARHAVAQQAGPGGERAASASSRPAPRTKSRWKEEAADDGHEQHAATHAADHGDRAQRQAQHEERDRPDPPRRAAAVGGERGRGVEQGENDERRSAHGIWICRFPAMLTLDAEVRRQRFDDVRQKSNSCSASRRRRAPGSAPSNTSTRTNGSRGTSPRRRATPGSKWCCTTCRKATRRSASAARPA